MTDEIERQFDQRLLQPGKRMTVRGEIAAAVEGLGGTRIDYKALALELGIESSQCKELLAVTPFVKMIVNDMGREEYWSTAPVIDPTPEGLIEVALIEAQTQLGKDARADFLRLVYERSKWKPHHITNRW